MNLKQLAPSRLARRAARCLSLAKRWLKPVYAGFKHGPIVLRDHPDNPRKVLALSGLRLVNTADFLPDRASFSGDSFWESPHLEFASKYLAEGRNFEFSSTRYYKLARLGRLPVPGYGPMAAMMHVQDFIHLIERAKVNEGRVGGRLVLAECVDGSFAVIDGKHRLAALIALGADKLEFSLAFENEIRELYRPDAAAALPGKMYSKSHALLERLGPAVRDVAEAQRVAAVIRSKRLETWADVYHPVPFREFRGLSTQVNPATPYRRLGIILRGEGSLRGAKILDLGCNLGFYSFSLAKRGACATGVEIRKDYHDIAVDLANLYQLPARFINAGVSPELIRSLGTQDVTLCFSTIQWVIAQNGFDYGMHVLREISRLSRVLYFDVPVNVGKECLICPPGQEVVYVERLLRENTQYASVECVGRVHPYGSDTRHVFRCET